MKTSFKVLATILILVLTGWEILSGISIAASSHNISVGDREKAILNSENVILIALILVVILWIPWKRILNKNH